MVIVSRRSYSSTPANQRKKQRGDLGWLSSPAPNLANLVFSLAGRVQPLNTLTCIWNGRSGESPSEAMRDDHETAVKNRIPVDVQ